MWTILGSLAVLTFVVLKFFSRPKKASHPLLKSAKGIPLLGSLDDFKGGLNILRTFVEYPLKYGPFVEVFLLTKRFLLITDVTAAKEILMKRPKKFQRVRALDYSINALKSHASMFTSKGNTWVHIRKSLVPSFSALNITSKIVMVAKEIHSYVLSMKNKLDSVTDDKKKAGSSVAVDMQYEAFSLTVRVITVVAFGLETSHPLVSYYISNQFQQDVKDIFMFQGRVTIYPFPKFFWKNSSNYNLEKAAIAANNRVYDHAKDIISYKRQLIKEGKLTSKSMIDTMITSEYNESDKALTDDEMMVNIRTFYIAGADTTAITLTWIIYYISLNPEVNEKIREEVKNVLFQGQSPDQFLTNEKGMDLVTIFPLMKYCNAVVKEVLRLRSPSHSIALSTVDENETFTLSNGIVIYPDDTVYINQDGIHTNPVIFENPKEFIPERWLENDDKKLFEMESSLLPFGFGPRICPGSGLAIQEVILALAFLTYYFNFALDCPKEEIQRDSAFVATSTKMPIVLSLA
jgi:cytochrome P450